MSVKVIPYLMMNGNANDAIQFYEQALNASVTTLVTYGDMPDFPSEDTSNLIAHAQLKVGESLFMISDSPSTSPVQQGNQVTICISSTDPKKSERYFTALKQGGTVKMPFQKTSFSDAYGSLVDKFGVTFLIDTEKQNANE
ncbi:VOC family protein [Bacillus sp. JCM 19041]|uniref:VOC family protein n=1 Tax=Bacillus sp. JCM 19041 TaxID=1460637 RepID=UPI0006D1A86A